MRLAGVVLSIGFAAGFGMAAQAASGGAAVPTLRSGCSAALSLQDARTLAAASPNARGFAENLHASLTTQMVRSGGGNAYVRVLAAEPHARPAEVGVYTVSLRTGRVTDDDQEPAEDAGTAAVRTRLMAKHCGSR